MYFIFIFISPSVPRSSVKKSVNQLIKNKRPNMTEVYLLYYHGLFYWLIMLAFEHKDSMKLK